MRRRCRSPCTCGRALSVLAVLAVLGPAASGGPMLRAAAQQSVSEDGGRKGAVCKRGPGRRCLRRHRRGALCYQRPRERPTEPGTALALAVLSDAVARVGEEPALGGRVLQAARAFECGEVIFEEKALAICSCGSLSGCEEAGRGETEPARQVLKTFLAMSAAEQQRLLDMHHDEKCEQSAALVDKLVRAGDATLMSACAEAVHRVLAGSECGSSAEKRDASAADTEPDGHRSGRRLRRNLTILLSVWERNAYALAAAPFVRASKHGTLGQLVDGPIGAACVEQLQRAAPRRGGSGDAGLSLRALFPNIALLPHSCRPNVKIATIEGFGQVVAATRINKGDVLASFYPEDTRLMWYGFDVRQEALSFLRGFVCGCPRCELGAVAAEPDAREQAQELEAHELEAQKLEAQKLQAQELQLEKLVFEDYFADGEDVEEEEEEEALSMELLESLEAVRFCKPFLSGFIHHKLFVRRRQILVDLENSGAGGGGGRLGAGGAAEDTRRSSAAADDAAWEEMFERTLYSGARFLDWWKSWYAQEFLSSPAPAAPNSPNSPSCSAPSVAQQYRNGYLVRDVFSVAYCLRSMIDAQRGADASLPAARGQEDAVTAGEEVCGAGAREGEGAGDGAGAGQSLRERLTDLMLLLTDKYEIRDEECAQDRANWDGERVASSSSSSSSPPPPSSSWWHHLRAERRCARHDEAAGEGAVAKERPPDGYVRELKRQDVYVRQLAREFEQLKGVFDSNVCFFELVRRALSGRRRERARARERERETLLGVLGDQGHADPTRV